MTTEQLLIPRYKVTSPYPGSPFKLEQVIEKHKFLSGKWYVPGFHYDPDDYPNIFQPLPWWCDRRVGDMPKYVKDGDVVALAKWEAGAETENGQQPMRLIIQESNWAVIANVMCHFEPATAEEYNEWKSKQR